MWGQRITLERVEILPTSQAKIVFSLVRSIGWPGGAFGDWVHVGGLEVSLNLCVYIYIYIHTYTDI